MPDKNRSDGFYYYRIFTSQIFSTSLTASRIFLYLILIKALSNNMYEGPQDKVANPSYIDMHREIFFLEHLNFSISFS